MYHDQEPKLADWEFENLLIDDTDPLTALLREEAEEQDMTLEEYLCA